MSAVPIKGVSRMKQHIARALCLALVLLAVTGVGRLFADENTVNLESVVVQNFQDSAAQPWFVVGSKFSTPGFPVVNYVKAWPASVFGADAAGKDLRSLGVAMLFDRKEYNWVDIVPGKKSGTTDQPIYEPVEIPLPGRIKMIDMWVWSANYDYYLEAYVRDYKGIVYTIPMGDLNFVGWKNLRINIPESIPQARKYVPRREGLSLVKFRIWTRPTEIVAQMTNDPKATDMDKAVKFYFSNIKVLTDTFETLYDGDNLADPSVVKDAWGAGATK
jgi:hypothetical protein